MQSKLFLISICAAVVMACKNDRNIRRANHIEEIVINKPESLSINFDKLFSDWKLIPLETNANSLISSISRLEIFEDKFFILDKATNSLVVFDDEGRFLFHIKSIGEGEGKYFGLQDFAIDKENRKIILYAHRPYKLLEYNLSGKFIKEKLSNRLYSEIGFSEGNLLMLSTNPYRESMLFAENTKSHERFSSLPSLSKTDLFESFKLSTPQLITSQNSYISFLYSDTVFQVEGGIAYPRYRIKFANNEVPKQMFDSARSAVSLYKAIMDKGYGFAITNFRENNRYITFTYSGGTVVVYSKTNKKSISFSFVKNEENRLYFYSTFAHDGDDMLMVSPIQAYTIKNELKILNRNSIEWRNLNKELKKLDSSINELSNPVLQIYTMK